MSKKRRCRAWPSSEESASPHIPGATQGVVVDASKSWNPYSWGIIGITDWTAGATAVAITPALNVGNGTVPIWDEPGHARSQFAGGTAANAADCTTIHLTDGSHNVPGGFAWFKFGCYAQLAPDLTGNGRKNFGLGQVLPAASGGCLNSKPFLDGEWGALPATPGNTYGCCTSITELTSRGFGNYIGSLPGNKASINDNQTSINYFETNDIPAWLPFNCPEWEWFERLLPYCWVCGVRNGTDHRWQEHLRRSPYQRLPRICGKRRPARRGVFLGCNAPDLSLTSAFNGVGPAHPLTMDRPSANPRSGRHLRRSTGGTSVSTLACRDPTHKSSSLLPDFGRQGSPSIFKRTRCSSTEVTAAGGEQAMDPQTLAEGTIAVAMVASQGVHGHVLAYLDPGSGSLLIQALIAAALTVPFVLRRQLKAGIDRLRGRPEEVQPPTRIPRRRSSLVRDPASFRILPGASTDATACSSARSTAPSPASGTSFWPRACTEISSRMGCSSLTRRQIAALPWTIEAYLVIRPREISFISYPYEWAFSQLKDAALATLVMQERALAHGMSLRDASAYNIQFVDGRPLLIDTLSFEPLQPGAPWPAYRQFCQHFLAPLALMAYRDPRGALLLRDFIDGIPLDLASALLPTRTRLRPGLAMHVHAHARAQRRSRTADDSAVRARVSESGRLALLDSLRRTVEGLRWTPSDTPWASYTTETSYSPEAAASKAQLVRAFLDRARRGNVWDVGANTGTFSAIAADAGRPVVAMDADPGAVEQMYMLVRSGDCRRHAAGRGRDKSQPRHRLADEGAPLAARPRARRRGARARPRPPPRHRVQRPIARHQHLLRGDRPRVGRRVRAQGRRPGCGDAAQPRRHLPWLHDHRVSGRLRRRLPPGRGAADRGFVSRALPDGASRTVSVPERMPRSLRAFTWYPLLIVASVILGQFVVVDVSPFAMFRPLVLALACVAVVEVVLGFLLRDWDRAGIATAVVLFGVLGWGDWRVLVMLALLTAVLVLLERVPRRHVSTSAITSSLNVFTSVLLLLVLAGAVLSGRAAGAVADLVPPVGVQQAVARTSSPDPDIYVIVMDGYARPDNLLTRFRVRRRALP